MKSKLLPASLLANALLLGMGVAHWQGWLPSVQPQSAKVQATSSQPQTPRTSHPPVTAPGQPALTWAALESEDYRQYMDNLRRVGCPEETVTDIIVADVRKLFGRERAKVPAGSSETRRQLARIDQQEAQVLESLLGHGWNLSLPENAEPGENRFAGMPKETVQQILSIEQHFSDQEDAIYGRSEGIMLPEDRQALRRLRQEKEQQLSALLGPEGFENYLITSSGTAQAWRENPWFQVKDEAEFMTVAKAQVEYDRAMDMAEGADEGATLRAEAEERYQNALKTALGSDRYAEFARSRDYRYQQIAALTKRYALPAGTAEAVFESKQALDNQVVSNPSEGNPAPEPAALREQAQAKIRNLLGEKAFASYAQLVAE